MPENKANQNENAAYVFDTYQDIKSDFGKVQECPGMYISSVGSAGAFHLFKEIFNNALDECVNELSPGDTITIDYYPELKQFTVTDNGRGIPFGEMVKSCSQLHTSTKFKTNRKYNLFSAGCNGVGLVVTTAMSSLMKMTSRIKYSNGACKEKTIEFDNCVLNEGDIIDSKKENGTKVTFIPSTKYLGEINIDSDDIITWLRHMSYLLAPHIKCIYNCHVDTSHGDVPHSRTFTAVSLAENVRFLGPCLEFEPMMFEFTKRDEGDHKQLQFAFSYDKTIADIAMDSYCNYVITTDGGYHEDACILALCDYLVKAAKKADPDAKYEVIRADCKKGLVAAVNLRAENVILGGQHKSKVESKEILEEGKVGISEAISSYFANNQNILTKIIAYLRQMARIRIEANKLKGIKPPKPMTMYDEAAIGTYCPISERNKKGYAELLITEGKSASGTIKKLLNPYYQALYAARGVLTNVSGMSFQTIVKKQVPSELIKILGCGIGSQFDINNLRWNKIILAQDADADGGFIKSLVSLFIIILMPELIEDGRLYSAKPPLYSLSEKSVKKFKLDRNYVYNKKEYFKLRDDIIVNNVEFADSPVGEPMPKKMFINWLEMNRKYVDALEKLQKKMSSDIELLEHVCWAIIMYPDIDGRDAMLTNYENYFKKQFTEMHFDKTTMSLYGSLNGRFVSIIIDDVLVKTATPFLRIMSHNNDIFVKYRNKHEDKGYRITTIYEFFKDILGKYAIDTEKRFKGLGETDEELLFLSAMNPRTRKLVRLTMEDRQRAIETMNMLHMDKFVEDRRQLLLTSDVDDDDIDT